MMFNSGGTTMTRTTKRLTYAAVASVVAALVGSSDSAHSAMRSAALPTFTNPTRATSVHKPDEGDLRQVKEAYGRLPVTFEVNQGQMAPEVSFVSRGPGYTLFLTSDSAVLALKRPSLRPALQAARPVSDSRPSQSPSTIVRMALIGAGNATVRGIDEQRGESHYLLGKNPTDWRTNIPHYARVSYEGIYPGIDIVYYSTGRQLEYDFIVAPGADPQRIALRFDGAEGARIDDDGNLRLDIGDGEVLQRKPVVYQDIAGTRQEIAGRYVKNPRNEIGFQIARYDTTHPLVIDPILVYSSYLGGSSTDVGRAIAVDAAGYAYVVGDTASLDFPVSPNGVQLTPADSSDIFVTKFNQQGSELVYSTYLGGDLNDNATGIAVDATGHVYVTGRTISRDFPVTPDAFQTASADATLGAGDVFVTKLGKSGSALLYSTYLGGSGNDLSHAIAVDDGGRAYVTGTTLSLDFPTTPGVLQPMPADPVRNEDAFVTKLNPRGSRLVYSTYLGGTARDIGFDIAVDDVGDAYVTGQTLSSDFPTTPRAFQPASGGGPFEPFDAFVSKLNRQGSALVYSTYLGGSNNDFGGTGIVVDGERYAYVAGITQSTDFPITPDALQSTNDGLGDVVVTKLNRRGTGLVYSTYLGGEGSEQSVDIAIDGAGRAYVSGVTFSPDFPVTPDAIRAAFAGAFDVFVAKLNRRGSALLYSTYLGGVLEDGHSGIAVDGAGNAYVAGFTRSRDFPIVPGAFQPDHGGGQLDAFIAKIGRSAPD